MNLSEKINYNHIPAKLATFKSGLAAKIHRWFRLTPSYGPDLVQTMLENLECGRNETVLDPFSGASTTLIECQLLGLKSYGFEINPFLHWIGETCLNWSMCESELNNILLKIESSFFSSLRPVNLDAAIEMGLEIPLIHNPFRWWRKDVLTDLLFLKKIISDVCENSNQRNFFRLALSGVLVPDLTNVTLGKLQLHFIDRENDAIDVIASFSTHARNMIQDLVEVSSNYDGLQSEIFHTDSTTLDGVNKELDPISCVITSPPYPNRYSYVWNTRPHLYFFDFISQAKEASSLDLKTIGGTWGVATSVLQKGVIPPISDSIGNIVSPVVEEIRAQDNLMANYVMKYFNLLATQILAMERLPQRNLRCAYVVGNSRIKDVYVETDVLLGRIFEALNIGYATKSIDRIRKRNSGKDLHESIVYAYKK